MAQRVNWKLFLDEKNEIDVLSALKTIEDYCKEKNKIPAKTCQGCILEIILCRGGVCPLHDGFPYSWDIEKALKTEGTVVFPPDMGKIEVDCSVV